MKDLALLEWDLQRGYVPEKFYYCSPENDRDLFIRRFPRGFINLPNADLVIDKMMFYAKLSKILTSKHLK